MKFAFAKDLEQHLTTTCGTPVTDLVVDLCPPEFGADLTVNGFLLARQLRRNPVQIAELVAGFLSGHADVQSATAVKAFANITLKPAAL